MTQQKGAFAYHELRSLSFIQLFHLCVALARQRWFRERKNDTDRELWPQAVRDEVR